MYVELYGMDFDIPDYCDKMGVTRFRGVSGGVSCLVEVFPLDNDWTPPLDSKDLYNKASVYDEENYSLVEIGLGYGYSYALYKLRYQYVLRYWKYRDDIGVQLICRFQNESDIAAYQVSIRDYLHNKPFQIPDVTDDLALLRCREFLRVVGSLY